jgi:hypothetical protein
VRETNPWGRQQVAAAAIESEAALTGLAIGLLGSRWDLTPPERALAIVTAVEPPGPRLAACRAAIEAGGDPLGEALVSLRSPESRRGLGATYTPEPIVTAMLGWALRQARPDRIIDPGAGSGRFLLAAARAFPDAELIGIEIDPMAALLLRANLAVRRLAGRARVLVGDYRQTRLPSSPGCSLFIGNPPYLRHHGIDSEWKRWYASTAQRFGVKASRLAGLHLHFFLRTLELAQPGDQGCFVTAAEWLDVNYGAALRALLAAELGATAIHILDPKALPFADAVTTGVITCFKVGGRSAAIALRQVASTAELGDLSDGMPVARARLAATSRWTTILRPGPAVPPGWIELGELCAVHRGQVTGANRIWIAPGDQGCGDHADLPERFLLPAVTKARELLAAGAQLASEAGLRRVIDLPLDLADLDPGESEIVSRFLDWARRQGADRSYIARHRKAWWAVGLKQPAPILCTYMARRPPAFVRNLCQARHINIAHGLYPRQPIADAALDALAAYLRNNVAQSSGRTYAGGLTKFEPKELERIVMPRLEEIAAIAAPPA